MTGTTQAIPLLLAVLLTACARTHVIAAKAPAPPPPVAVPLRGFWVSEGYGSQLEFSEADELMKSQVTAISCIPTWSATLVARDAGALTYRRAAGPVTFVVRPGPSPDSIRVHPTGTASEMIARRVPGKLAVCERPTPNTPRSNFEVFAATWAENYPFFDLTKTDWAAVVNGQRARVTDQTTPSELFEILKGMIAPLEDAHSSLDAPKLDGSGRHFDGFQSRPGALDPEKSCTHDGPNVICAGFDRAEALISRYVTGPLRKFCEGQIEFGMLGDDVGYLRIGGFNGYHPDGSFESGLEALEAALDAVFADTRRWRGLVIDVRINGGGFDPYGLAIAARLTGVEYVAYSKQARVDPVDPTRWSAEQPSVVKPSARPGFRGPVVELTGPNSISAAECFTQALIERVPSVVRVGQNTQGVFSDVMERRLPNGWSFGIPNERYVTRGKTYDHTGIPPTITVPVFTPSDIEVGRDTAVEAALRILRAK